jgi:hypothetical protein
MHIAIIMEDNFVILTMNIESTYTYDTCGEVRRIRQTGTFNADPIIHEIAGRIILFSIINNRRRFHDFKNSSIQL